MKTSFIAWLCSLVLVAAVGCGDDGDGGGGGTASEATCQSTCDELVTLCGEGSFAGVVCMSGCTEGTTSQAQEFGTCVSAATSCDEGQACIDSIYGGNNGGGNNGGTCDDDTPASPTVNYDGSWDVLGDALDVDTDQASVGKIFSNYAIDVDSANRPVVAYPFGPSDAETEVKLRVKRWDGSAWQLLGQEIATQTADAEPSIRGLGAGPNESLYVLWREDPSAGGDSVLKLGTFEQDNWTIVDGPAGLEVDPLGSSLATLGVGADGTVAVFGHSSGGRVVHTWDGSAWSQLGEAISAPVGFGDKEWLEVGADGSVYVVYQSTPADGAMQVLASRWTGSAWEQLGEGPLAVEPDDQRLSTSVGLDSQNTLYVELQFEDACNVIVTWTGSAWTPSNQDSCIFDDPPAGFDTCTGPGYFAATGTTGTAIEFDSTDTPIVGAFSQVPNAYRLADDGRFYKLHANKNPVGWSTDGDGSSAKSMAVGADDTIYALVRDNAGGDLPQGLYVLAYEL
jgi:hypothetical protein